jgi:hypothetical protein
VEERPHDDYHVLLVETYHLDVVSDLPLVLSPFDQAGIALVGWQVIAPVSVLVEERLQQCHLP